MILIDFFINFFDFVQIFYYKSFILLCDKNIWTYIINTFTNYIV